MNRTETERGRSEIFELIVKPSGKLVEAKQEKQQQLFMNNKKQESSVFDTKFIDHIKMEMEGVSGRKQVEEVKEKKG